MPCNGPIRAGRSDKYGQVYVERIGNTGFPDPDEPIAVFRAQDNLAQRAMAYYAQLCRETPGVPTDQKDSVARQAAAFHVYRVCHPDRMRTPGTPAAALPGELKP